MANYMVCYRVEQDPGHRQWLIGPMPSRQMALDHFNYGDARKEGLGEFGFDETVEVSDYFLVEQPAPPSGPFDWIPIFNVASKAAGPEC